jgi:hypothetical protein
MYERYVLMNYIGYTLVVLAVMAAELREGPLTVVRMPS